MMSSSTSPPPTPLRRRHYVVIVLGDVGRSPRMQYHARSLLEQGHYVSLVGYDGEDLIPDLKTEDGKWTINNDSKEERGGGKSNKTIQKSEENLLHVVRFQPYSPPIGLKKFKLLGGKIPIGLPVYLFLRLFGLLFALMYALWFRVTKRNNRTIPVDCILVQNPPSIPLLFISYLYCITHMKIRTSSSSSSSTVGGRKMKKLSRPGLVIDWHNLGYTMFGTSPNHPITKLAMLYEKKIAPLSDGNLCVTSSMKEFLLSSNFSSTGSMKEEKMSVLHDRPPEFFQSTSLEVKHELMMKLRDEMELSCPELKQMRLSNLDTNCDDDDDSSTIFTKSVFCDGKKKIIPQENQPALLISSTSWTPDEDFSILLDALVDLNIKLNKEKETTTGKELSYLFPHIVVIVTGKGPQKAMYQSKIAKLNLNHISIITLWLEAKDYPLLLGCSDLGISLHVSTSGLDLPMKIYDFFGCEVPVCAVSFSCLSELVQDGVNGHVFDSSNELSSQIYKLFHGKNRSEEGDCKLDGELKTFRNNIRGISRWRENWIENAQDILMASCPDDDEEVAVDEDKRKRN